MKKIIVFAFIIGSLCLFTLNACKKSSGTAFEHSTMRSWFDTKCASCHGSGGSGKSSWYYNPENYEVSIQSNINNLYRAVYTQKTMPPSGVTSAELNQFKAWYDAGYPAK